MNNIILTEDMEVNAKLTNDKPYITEIVINNEVDTDPRFEFEGEEYEDCTEEERTRYKKQDQEAIDNYGHTWQYVIVRASAKVYVPMRDTSRLYCRIIRIDSDGLTMGDSFDGIDKQDITNEGDNQVENLKNLLGRLNVVVPKNVIIRREQ